MKKIVFILLIILNVSLLIFASGCSKEDKQTIKPITNADKCLDLKGKWINSVNECEEISALECDQLNGTFNECASACRNDPKADICTMQCVQVCTFI
ncbi:hypothetical protein K9L67_04425 [Candidatus Woesearchaeota archaeon]|nr:hypothetical protein [Candidatus Woesearchaeota archaeon]MCF7901445.1 hypothetical protein [Candidatus Woesearchaeota archaeon]MCF8013530.1 hypothetical protein [Candidatus Woesearchaeota archaeon]